MHSKRNSYVLRRRSNIRWNVVSAEFKSEYLAFWLAQSLKRRLQFRWGIFDVGCSLRDNFMKYSRHRLSLSTQQSTHEALSAVCQAKNKHECANSIEMAHSDPRAPTHGCRGPSISLCRSFFNHPIPLCTPQSPACDSCFYYKALLIGPYIPPDERRTSLTASGNYVCKVAWPPKIIKRLSVVRPICILSIGAYR
jgi:hypothetical protein